MVDIDQINVRVPDPAKDTVKKVARLLREDTTFLHRLTRFLDDDEVAGRSSFVMDRLERLEARVADLTGRVDRVAPRAAGTPTQLDMLAGDAKPFRSEKPPSSRPEKPVASNTATAPGNWTAGEGRGRRLTPEGEAEMHRRIIEGQSDREIADALGVRPFTVGNQRKRIAR